MRMLRVNVYPVCIGGRINKPYELINNNAIKQYKTVANDADQCIMNTWTKQTQQAESWAVHSAWCAMLCHIVRSKTMNRPFPVKLGELPPQVEALPAVRQSEVASGLKGRADRGEAFVRFAFLCWKGSISNDFLRNFSGSLRHALAAAKSHIDSVRDQNFPMPGEVVGRAWAVAAQAWADKEAGRSSAPKKDAHEKTAQAEQTAQAVKAATEALARENSVLEKALQNLIAELDSARTIKEVREIVARYRATS